MEIQAWIKKTFHIRGGIQVIYILIGDLHCVRHAKVCPGHEFTNVYFRLESQFETLDLTHVYAILEENTKTLTFFGEIYYFIFFFLLKLLNLNLLLWFVFNKPRSKTVIWETQVWEKSVIEFRPWCLRCICPIYFLPCNSF